MVARPVKDVHCGIEVCVVVQAALCAVEASLTFTVFRIDVSASVAGCAGVCLVYVLNVHACLCCLVLNHACERAVGHGVYYAVAEPVSFSFSDSLEASEYDGVVFKLCGLYDFFAYMVQDVVYDATFFIPN